MHYTKHTRNDFLYKLRDLTSRSIDVDEIRTVVSGYGYDSVKLEEGRRLVNKLEKLNDEATRQTIQKKKLFAKKKKIQLEIHKKYMKIVKLSRIAFVNNLEAQEVLGLNGARERTYDKWYTQVRSLISNLLVSQDYLSELEQFGIAKTEVVDLQNQLSVLEENAVACLRITGIVRMLNQNIKKETIEVQQWVSKYIKVARIAMDENPQLGKVLKKTIDG